jgi:hypothetical protein
MPPHNTTDAPRNQPLLSKKLRRWIILSVALLVAGAGALIWVLDHHSGVFVVSGPLTPQDVAEIKRAVSGERAALVSGEFAPTKLRAPPSWIRVHLLRNFRERVAGQPRSIVSRDGQNANVDFSDRWDPGIGYDYQVRRTTNGWKVVGVGYHGPARK